MAKYLYNVAMVEVKRFFVAIAIANAVYVVFDYRNKVVWFKKIYKHINFVTAIRSFFILMTTGFTAASLIGYIPWMRKGWVNGIFDSDTGGNIFIPSSNIVATTTWVELIAYTLFVIAIALAVPIVAYYEEKYFRSGYNKMKDIILINFLFGFIHLLVGVPIAAALALGVTGLLLSYCYRQYYSYLIENGIEKNKAQKKATLFSAAHHSMHNLFLLALLLVLASMKY